MRGQLSRGNRCWHDFYCVSFPPLKVEICWQYWVFFHLFLPNFMSKFFEQIVLTNMLEGMALDSVCCTHIMSLSSSISVCWEQLEFCCMEKCGNRFPSIVIQPSAAMSNLACEKNQQEHGVSKSCIPARKDLLGRSLSERLAIIPNRGKAPPWGSPCGINIAHRISNEQGNIVNSKIYS